jgi:formylglycine-generating enzyme required for sulfatase activity
MQTLHKIGIALTVTFACITAAAAQTRQDIAVFFPVTTYKGSKVWQPLPRTTEECTNIAGDLSDLYGFKTEVLANQTVSQIEDKLAALALLKYGPKDQLLLFFSMHGYFDEAGEGGCLVPFGGLDNDPSIRTWLLHSKLRHLVSSIPCEHILVCIDACYSGTFGGTKGMPNEVPGPDCTAKINNALNRKSRLYLTAGGKETVPADSDFARRWRSALGGKGGEDGLLTFTELQLQLNEANPTPKGGDFTGHLGGSFVFVPKNGCGAPTPKVVADPETAACQSARRQNSLDAWDYYIGTYCPENRKGRYCSEAHEERAWLWACKSDTKAAYQIFLDTYPESRHKSEAEKKIKPTIPKSDPMLLITGGTFQMGSTENDNEKPVHTVKVSDFYLGKYEVTVAEFRAFAEDKNYQTDAEKENYSWFYTTEWVKKEGINWRHDAEGNAAEDNHPVLHVSWNDAVAYCAWLSEKTGLRYRLPTEAEWEYAAGNGNQHTKYSWGNDDPSGKNGGNVADESKRPSDGVGWSTKFEGYNDGYWFTAPVGSYNPNTLGLYDMTGNVWEWCSDWYGADYYKNSPATNPTGPTSGSDRVVRGGSWYNAPRDCRVANRYGNTPGGRYGSVGFRLARTK